MSRHGVGHSSSTTSSPLDSHQIFLHLTQKTAEPLWGQREHSPRAHWLSRASGGKAQCRGKSWAKASVSPAVVPLPSYLRLLLYVAGEIQPSHFWRPLSKDLDLPLRLLLVGKVGEATVPTHIHHFTVICSNSPNALSLSEENRPSPSAPKLVRMTDSAFRRVYAWDSHVWHTLPVKSPHHQSPMKDDHPYCFPPSHTPEKNTWRSSQVWPYEAS